MRWVVTLHPCVLKVYQTISTVPYSNLNLVWMHRLQNVDNTVQTSSTNFSKSLLGSRLVLVRTPKGHSYSRISTSMSSSMTTTSERSKLQRLLPTHSYIWHIFGEHWKPLIWLSCFSCTIIYKLFPHIMHAIWVEVLQWKNGIKLRSPRGSGGWTTVVWLEVSYKIILNAQILS